MDIGSRAPSPDPVPVPGRRKGARPVQWLAPLQLLRTGSEVAQASLFARFADKRDVEAVTPRQIYDLSLEAPAGEPFVVDYVADTGDGFDPSFAVAASVAQGCWGGDEPRTRLMLLGGDEVYPVASIAEYHDRLVHPFAQAYVETSGAGPADPPWPTPDGCRPEAPFVLAIPGNHDWYDSLAAFRRVFCETWVRSHDPAGSPSQGRLVAPDTERADVVTPHELQAVDRFAYGWTCLQSRSYWAVRLPHGWWVWGIDIQLDAAIDAAQLAYFREAALQLSGDDALVVCTARPSWVDPVTEDLHRTSNKQTLVRFLDRVLGPEGNRHRVRMLLSGDKHHYARHTLVEDQDEPAASAGRTPPARVRPEQLVTCGSGGAYLSSTHHEQTELAVPWDVHDTTGGTAYALRAAFPDQATSQALRSRWLRAATGNTAGLPALFAVVYAVLAVAMARTSGDWLTWLRTVGLCGAGVLGLGWYGGSTSGRGRRPTSVGGAVGLAHGVVHVLVALGLLLVVRPMWAQSSAPWPLLWSLRLLGTAAALVAAGMLGAVVLAAYLRRADALGMHENDAFSALGIVDYKGHLRLTVLPDRLDVRMLGITATSTEGTAGEIAARFDEHDRFTVLRVPEVDLRTTDVGPGPTGAASATLEA
jgi:hypothetical protein